MRTRQKWMIYILLIVFVIVTAAYSILHSLDVFVFKDHLQDKVFTVNEQDVSLQETSYYIMIVEDYIEELAKQYNPDDTSQFWNIHFSAGMDSTFLRTMAKDLVYEICIYDYIMEQEANLNALTLTEQEEKEARDEAADIFNSMSEETIQLTQLTQEKLENIMLRRALAKSYAYYLIETEDFSSYSDTPQEELSYDGNYYMSYIKSKYKVRVNKSLWNEISLGDLTI